MPPISRARDFFAAYTQDLTSDELSRLFTRDTPEAARFFTRGVDSKAFRALPWHRRGLRWTQAFFMAFAMRLTPARRLIYGVALLAAAIGVISLFRGFSMFGVPIIIPPFFFRIGLPTLAFAPGTQWLIFAFALMNLLVLLEVFDRLSLKRDLEVAREIQLAMLPDGTWAAPGVEASGLTRPANTVGGDFYDILPQPDGRVMVALGDVAGKASPAALLMALFLAMLRTLADEHLPLTELVRRLNIQVSKHAPPSRFITLFLGLFDPRTGELEYVNAGQTPPLLLRASGAVDKLATGGYVHCATDWEDYAYWMAGVLAAEPKLANSVADSAEGFAPRPAWRPLLQAGLQEQRRRPRRPPPLPARPSRRPAPRATWSSRRWWAPSTARPRRMPSRSSRWAAW